MSYFLRTIDNPLHRKEIFDRLDRLDPEDPPRWGRMSAPKMLAHLCDQMRLLFNDEPATAIPGPPRLPVLKQILIYLAPWPKGKIQGPPEAFLSDPGDWSNDVSILKELVDRFVSAPASRKQWPEHPNFGRLSRREWGYFCYRHFHHHLSQFGV